MPLQERSYRIAPRGLAESFTESEVPVDFALQFKNRFINTAGGAEKRQGIQQLGSTISGAPTITGLHEFVDRNGVATLFVSGNGVVYQYDGSSTYTIVHNGLNADARLRSVQMDDKLIFWNGVDRDFYTTNGVDFQNLVAIIERGNSDTGSDQTHLIETDISNWLTETDAAVNDLVYYPSVSAYAIVTEVTASGVNHTEVSTSAASSISSAARSPAPGDEYEVQDLVALNIVPTSAVRIDNAATLGAGSDETTVVVSAISAVSGIQTVSGGWINTEAKIGDWVRNTTRSGVGQITALATAAATITYVSGQTTGDSIVLLKSAYPISTWAHVHFGVLYNIDARDQRKVRFSGAGNPEARSTDAGTVDTATIKAGDFQPKADSLLAIGSHQRFLTFFGKQAIYAYQGTDPTATDGTFGVVGLFPQGLIAADGHVSIGNDEVWASEDGVQDFALTSDASTLNRANLSEVLRTKLRELFADTDPADIFMYHYPRRSWVALKVGSEMYVFNYSAYLGEERNSNVYGGGRESYTQKSGSWSKFDGLFARQRVYLVRRNGTLISAGDGGKIYICDVDGVYADAGEQYSCVYQTGWLYMDDPNRSMVRKAGKYIKCQFDSGASITHTVRAESGFDNQSTDSIAVTAAGGSSIGVAVVGIDVIGGSSVEDIKVPLRWRGQQVRLTFETDDSNGPDSISRYTIYFDVFGKGTWRKN